MLWRVRSVGFYAVNREQKSEHTEDDFSLLTAAAVALTALAVACLVAVITLPRSIGGLICATSALICQKRRRTSRTC